MNRRATLVSTTAILSVGLAGCSLLTTGPSDDPPDLPDGLSAETHRWNDCVLRDTPICDTPDLQKSHNAILSDRETARNRLAENTDANDFIEDTDFSQSYVLLVQYRMQSARRLVLDTIERTETDLRVGVTTESPNESYGDDSVPHTLAVRITDEQSDGPRTITVSVDGDQTGTVSQSES